MTSGIAASLAFIFIVLYLEVFILLELLRFVFWLIDKLDGILRSEHHGDKKSSDSEGGGNHE